MVPFPECIAMTTSGEQGVAVGVTVGVLVDVAVGVLVGVAVGGLVGVADGVPAGPPFRRASPLRGVPPTDVNSPPITSLPSVWMAASRMTWSIIGSTNALSTVP